MHDKHICAFEFYALNGPSFNRIIRWDICFSPAVYLWYRCGNFTKENRTGNPTRYIDPYEYW